jgi:hypothetical protein
MLDKIKIGDVVGRDAVFIPPIIYIKYTIKLVRKAVLCV